MKLINIFTGNYLDSNVFRKRFWIIMAITAIAVFYMFSKFQSHKTYRELTRTKNELNIIRAKHSTIHAERIRITRETYLKAMLKKHNVKLQKSENPPIKLD